MFPLASRTYGVAQSAFPAAEDLEAAAGRPTETREGAEVEPVARALAGGDAVADGDAEGAARAGAGCADSEGSGATTTGTALDSPALGADPAVAAGWPRVRAAAVANPPTTRTIAPPTIAAMVPTFARFGDPEGSRSLATGWEVETSAGGGRTTLGAGGRSVEGAAFASTPSSVRSTLRDGPSPNMANDASRSASRMAAAEGQRRALSNVKARSTTLASSGGTSGATLASGGAGDVAAPMRSCVELSPP